jgi:3D (Asp-Asp-Asp) domain-containing protein
LLVKNNRTSFCIYINILKTSVLMFLATAQISCQKPIVLANDSVSQIDQDQPEFPMDSILAAPPKTKKLVGSLRPSFYWISLEPNDGSSKTHPLLDLAGNVLVNISEDYFKKLSMEGTGRLLDGRVINYHGRVVKPDGTKEIRWRWCGPEAPHGFGYEDRLLNPFRSVAVDPSVIPLDSKVYIPAARGAKLPDGSIHDGYFMAVDIGDLIKSKKIDIFTSFGDQSEPFLKIGMETGRFVNIYIVP